MPPASEKVLVLGIVCLWGCSSSSAASTAVDASAPDSNLEAGAQDSALEAGADAGGRDAEAGAEAGAGCFVSVAAGDVNPANVCQSCQPATSTTAWTNLPNGTGCGGSWGTCTNGNCLGRATASSCTAGGAGMTNCGDGSDSCCASLAVPGGTYARTYANDGSGASGQADYATVTGLRLDEYEVTVGRFRQFVKAFGSGWMPPAGSGKHAHLAGGQGLADTSSPGAHETGWDALDDPSIAPTDANLTASCIQPSFATWTPTAGSNENLPINCVNASEAYAFCIWDGGFLPSEAEWELAAAGGNQQRAYPWGGASPGTSDQYAVYGCLYPTPSASDGGWGCTGVSNIAPVGSAPAGASASGQLDLVGNVWEWTADFWTAYVDGCTDCAYLSSTPSGQVFRGGGYGDDATALTPPVRSSVPPTLRLDQVGLRCARSP
jgi:formylglycine-generating enzyme required for sulfatase activity